METKNNLAPLETDDNAQKRIDQVRALREQASKGGLTFEGYLTPDLALWVLDKIENGLFLDPGEAVSTYADQAKEIEPYPDIHRQIQNCIVQNGIKSGVAEGISAHEFIEELLNNPEKDFVKPAVWIKIQQDGQTDS